MHEVQENLKQTYEKILGLNGEYSVEDINNLYRKKVYEIIGIPNIDKEQLVSRMLLLNKSSNYLISYITNNRHIEDNEKICINLGLTYKEAKQIFFKRNKITGNIENFDSWLRRRSIFKITFEGFIEEIISLYTDIIPLLLMRYERLVNMFETDCEFQQSKLDFKNWILDLIQIYTTNYKNKQDEFSLDDEFEIFIDDINSGNNFLVYLKDKTIELDLCKKLNLNYLLEKNIFDSKHENISFRKYLEDLLYTENVIARLGITEEQLDKFYSTYLKEGYNGKKIDFVIEFDKTIDYCFKLKKGYFFAKKEYLRLPQEKKPITFANWLEAETIAHDLGGYPKIIENIYLKQVNDGYTGTMKDLITIYTTLKK